MAKATKVVETPGPPPYKVVLELNQDEAEVLRSLLGQCSGPFNGPRLHTGAIWDSLCDADVKKRSVNLRNDLYIS
jgi:hypothetical protein